MSKQETKQVASNTFAGGLVTDSNPILTPNNVLTDCINGAIITHNGNEFTLQNDMGNVKTSGILSEGFRPIAMESRDGIAYIISKNDDTKEIEIGTYPGVLYAQTNLDNINHTNLIDIEISNILTYSQAVDIFERNELIEIDDPAFLVCDNLPEFVKTSYTKNNTPIKPITIDLEDIRSENFIISNEKIKIGFRSSVANIIEKNSIPRLVYMNGQILGYFDISVKLDTSFKTSRVIGVLQYGDTTIEQELVLEDSLYKGQIYIDNIFTDVDTTFTTSFKLIDASNNISLLYDANQIQYNCVLSTLPTTPIVVFPNYYYYHVNDHAVDVSFDAQLLLNDEENLSIEISDFEITNNKLNLTNSKILEITKNEFLYTCSFALDDIFKYDNIYIFYVKYKNEIVAKRWLIINTAFNKFVSTTNDFGYISGNEWASNYNFGTIYSDVELSKNDDEIILDNVVDHRQYKTNVQIDGTISGNKHEEFIMNYIPYVTRDTEIRYPKISFSNNWNVKLKDSNIVTGIWTNVLAEDVDTKLSVSKTLEFTGNEYLETKELGERKYVTSNDMIRISFDFPNEDSTPIEYNGNKLYGIQVHFMNSNDDILNDFQLLHSAELPETQEDWHQYIASMLNQTANAISDIYYSFTNYNTQQYFYDMLGSEFTHPFKKNMFYENISKYHNKPFIPIEISITGGWLWDGFNLLPHQNDTVYGIISVINNNGDFNPIVIPVKNDSSIEYFTTDFQKIKSICEFWNNHLYTVDNYENIDVTKLKLEDINISTQESDISEIDVQSTINYINIKGIKSNTVVSIIDDVPNTNLEFEDVSVYYKIQPTQNEILNFEDTNNVVDALYTEMKESIDIINNKNIFGDNSGFDLSETQFGIDKSIRTVSDINVSLCDKFDAYEKIDEGIWLNIDLSTDALYLSDSVGLQWVMCLYSDLYLTYNDKFESSFSSIYKQLGKDVLIKRMQE